MRELEKERDALRQLISQALGDDYRQPSTNAGQVRAGGLDLDILALPMSRSSETTIQVLDAADPLYGRFRFIMGVSRTDLGDLSDVLL